MKPRIETARVSDQQGAVLIISLVFLLVLTLVAVIAMQGTITDQRISSNVAFKAKSFESSESPRPKTGVIVDHHVYERDWSMLDGSGQYIDATGAVVYEGLTVDTVAAEKLHLENSETEDPTDPSTLITDMNYTRTAPEQLVNNDRVTDTLNAVLSVYRTPTRHLPGHSAAMVSGYENIGMSSAGAGAAIFYEVRSTGTTQVATSAGTVQKAGSARSATSADIRILIRN